MSSPEVPAPPPQGAGSGSAPPRPQRLVERDGREVALEVAIARGVGLVGAGAPAALRAFLVNTLETARPEQFVFVVPKIDLGDLLELRGEGSPPRLPLLPAGLVVTESFDEAVDLVECEARARALAASDGQERATHWEPTFVLLAMTSRYALTRLRMVLDLGSGYGVAAVLLGYWRPGCTVSVWPGGQVCALGPGLGRVMREVWLGDLGAARAVEQLIRIARRERGPSGPSGSPAS